MIKKEMILLDIVEKYPETEDSFRQYDNALGKCLLCHNLFDSIEDIADKYDLDLKELLDKVNKVIKK